MAQPPSPSRSGDVSALEPVDRPLNLIPVGLKEAALDSPTFRATSLFFADQVEALERWLEAYVKSGTKLANEMSAVELAVNGFIQNMMPPTQVSEAVMDHDYTLLATQRCGEAAREFWQAAIKTMRRSETTVIEPIRSFIASELRAFKDARRNLEQSQRNFDAVLARYASQAKTKEASSLREDAFQLHEARRAYLKASMDFCVHGPLVRSSLDKLLVRIFCDQWKEFKNAREPNTVLFSKWNAEMDRVRGWSREMENSERAFRQELLVARKQVEDSAAQISRPSRELDDYAEKPSQYPGGRPTSAKEQRPEKQGWLNLKTLTGKPSRTLWPRRWFFVKHGIFGSLIQGARSGGVEESEKIGVLLCSVRPAPQEERRFCFEVKTKDTSIILQAETQDEAVQWINTFEAAKRKALEDPSSTETSTAAPTSDLAFAISPPVAPEFAAKTAEGNLSQSNEDSAGGLGVPDQGFASRSSVDVSSPRRSTVGERDDDRGRDHAARFMQATRKALPGAQHGSSSGGGIASLISASHNILPVGPGTPRSPEYRSFTVPTSSLAPSTLANPPAPTNLSKTAVAVSGDRNIGVGYGDGSGVPGSLMSNIWGTEKWGYVNRLDRDEKPTNRPPTAPTGSSVRPAGGSVDDSGVMDGSDSRKDFGTLNASDSALTGSPKGHRKTVSMAPGSTSTRQQPPQDEGFPNYYPLPLKAQDAQFRILFPSVPRSERVLLVFRATWNPSEQQEFPGRVYVTAREIYFYSHHLGLVLISGVRLSTVTEVTAAPGRDCDFLYLHIKDTTRPGELRRITIKTFLEPLRLLQRRMSYLVKSSHAEVPDYVEEILKNLIRLEVQEPGNSSPDEEDTIDFHDDDLDVGLPKRSPRDVKNSLRIDGSLYGQTLGRTGREVMKFKLPAQAVVYNPEGMGHAALVRDYSVSAKALFHMVFGDKSAMFQTLYRDRWADRIVQGPWTTDEHDHLKRQISWSFDKDKAAAVVQRIDVQNDHLCYVVTEIKTPRHLPMASSLQVVSKYVITHSAKSQCRFAIFHKLRWLNTPYFAHARRLVEKCAQQNLEADAIEISVTAMDQVVKLGVHSKTNKAIQIFGGIGTSTQIAQFGAADVSTPEAKNRRPRKYTLLGLYRDEATSQLFRAVSGLFDIAIALVKGVINAATAHSILVFILVLSMTYNTWYGYRDGMGWYHERNAGKFMARLGVRSDPMISRAVYIQDIEHLISTPNMTEWTAPRVTDQGGQAGALSCRTTFEEVVSSAGLGLNMGAGTSSRHAGARLQDTRQRLARYRHDLLVAMRVVNRVEGEVLQGEWEEWLRSERNRCEKMRKLLAKRGHNGTAGGSAQTEVLGLEHELAEYCGSCEAESGALGAA